MKTEKEIKKYIKTLEPALHTDMRVREVLEWVLSDEVIRYVCPYDRAIACDMKDGCLTCEYFNGEKHNED